MADEDSALRRLFEQAHELPQAQREAFLAAHCSDRGLRMRVLGLLAADAGTHDGVLGGDALLLAGALRAQIDAPALEPGQRIAGWEIVAPLGEGGSSTVFHALRTVEGVEQHAALKLLRRALYTNEAQRQFRRERLALTQLAHPAIARLIEGGVTPDRFAYLALELVDGVPITQFVRERRLDLRTRLDLFLQVCRAVAAAHAALIVHRDLKPSNVLVTRGAQVKLLDFGIAKLLDADDETRTQLPTFTPAYAAPEQRDGGAITTATDTYALGVLLGELVTGKRLNDGADRTPSQRIDETTEPGTLPATPQATRRLVRGDLDNILGKALEDDPARRYASAAALADDIERLLKRRPVSAHPPSRWYRANKFVQRHRGGVAVTALLVVAVLASLGIALWQAGVARRQARLAQQQAQRATAVRDLLVGLFDAEIPSRPHGEMPGTAELLDLGAKHALADLGETPAVQSDLLTALARVYDHLALPAKGAPLLDAAIAAARRVTPLDPALLGAALSERGEAELTANRFTDAIKLLDQAMLLQQQADPAGLALAETLDRRALAASQSGDHDRAIADYEAALAIRRKRLPADDADILNDYAALGNAQVRAGHPELAVGPLQKALAGAQAKYGEHHVKTAHYMKGLGNAYGLQRRYADALQLTARAVALERELYPPGSPDVVNGLNNLGNYQLTMGRLGAARATLEDARRRNHEAGLDESLGQTFVLGYLARAYEALGDTAQAAALLDEARATARKVVGPAHARTLALDLQAARVAFLRDPATATALRDVAAAITAHPEQLRQLRSRSEPEAWYALGLAQAALGDEVGAGATWKQAVDALPQDHVDPLTLPLVAALARFERTHGDATAADALLESVIARAAIDLPPTHFAVGELHLALAESRVGAQGIAQLDAAEAAFSELPADHPWRVRAAALRKHFDAR